MIMAHSLWKPQM